MTSSGDSGAGALRTVIAAASGDDTIIIDPGIDPVLTSGPIDISVPVAIEGQGASTVINGTDQGGGIFVFETQSGRSSLTNLTLTGGQNTYDDRLDYTGDGGAVDLIDSLLTISNVTLSGNSASDGGGAIYAGSGSQVDLLDSTVSGNSAGNGGGGVFVDSESAADIWDSTITGNEATSAEGFGGGLVTSGSASLIHDTFYGNSAPVDGVGGNIAFSTSPSTIQDTIIAGGSAQDSSTSNCYVDEAGDVTSDGYNLEDTSPSQCGLGATGDLIGVGPMLGPLAGNGGPTETMALEAGSPAIGAEPARLCSRSDTSDQRGFPRPGQGETNCDIGAYELEHVTLGLDCAPSSVVVAAQSTCTVTVNAPPGAPGPAGAVTLASDGSGSFAGPCNLAASGSVSTCSVAYTPAAPGSQTIFANDPSNGEYVGASATSVLGVALRPTATSVACEPSPIAVGQTTVCTATVADAAGSSAGPPSGAVSFSASGSGTFGGSGTCVLAGSGAAASCSVLFTPTSTAASPQTVAAAYPGDGARSGSAGSSALTVQAGKRAAALSELCTPGTVAPGATVTCTATVSPGATSSRTVPTGSVSFTARGAEVVRGGGSCRLTATGASARCPVTFTVSAAATGTFTVTATYSGDAVYATGAAMTNFAIEAAAGQAASVTAVSGTVLIQLPGRHRFVPLARGPRAVAAADEVAPVKGSTVSVPVGSTIDSRKGRVKLASARDYLKPSNHHHRLQNASLTASIFTIKQMTEQQARKRSHHKARRPQGIPPTDLLLKTPPGQLQKARCRRSGGIGSGLVRAISGHGEGLFRTFGRNSVTTIRDATWVIEDRCDGTLTEIGKGSATVTPLRHADRHQKRATIRAGQGVLIKGRFL